MTVLICSFSDCGVRTELGEATRCSSCGRRRCARCGRCWHERSLGVGERGATSAQVSKDLAAQSETIRSGVEGVRSTQAPVSRPPKARKTPKPKTRPSIEVGRARGLKPRGWRLKKEWTQSELRKIENLQDQARERDRLMSESAARRSDARTAESRGLRS